MITVQISTGVAILVKTEYIVIEEIRLCEG